MWHSCRSMASRAGWCIGVLLFAVSAYGEPPKVVKAMPDNEAADVQPGVRELRIEFDQPMNPGGHSVVGGGPSFPTIVGKPRWANDRTFVLTMRLEPDHAYWLSINSDRFTNFRSKAGESAVPYPISFNTAGKAAAIRLTVEQNRRSIEQLRHAIDQAYSHRDLRNLDWDKLFKEFGPRLEAAQTPGGFASEASKMLARAEDLHIWLKIGERVVGTHRRSVVPNYNMISLSQAVPGWERRSGAVYSGRFADGIGYVLIGTWDHGQAKEIEAVYDALKECADAKGLIIDVRPNSGGDELLAQQLAGCFIDEPKVYAKHVIRAEGKFTRPMGRAVQPNKDRPAFRGKIAVLMGPANMSSCESFLMMMQQVPGCVLVGERSYGSSGNPQPVTLESGVVVFLPCWRDLRLDGTGIEGEGLKPDIEVQAERRDFLTGDPVLQAALKALRNAK